jgi:hypothetical protein
VEATLNIFSRALWETKIYLVKWMWESAKGIIRHEFGVGAT